jgi:hypothetical protein
MILLANIVEEIDPKRRKRKRRAGCLQLKVEV